MRGTVKFTSPDILEANSESDLKFLYKSHESKAYHIRSVYLSPTWNMTNKSNYVVDKVVFPETEKLISIGKTYFPPALGGQQGFRTGFEVSPYFEEEMEYEVVWAGPIRKPVSDTTLVDTLLHIPEGNSISSKVQEVLDLWGFQVTYSTDINETRKHIRKLSLSCFVGVLPQGSDDATLNSVGEVVTVAVEEGVWPLIFTDDHSYSDILPEEAIVIGCDISSQNDVERESSLVLHTVRFSEEGGFTSLLFDRFKAELQEVAESTEAAGRTALRRVIEALALDTVLRASGIREKLSESLQRATTGFSGHSENGNQAPVDLTHLANADSQIINICVFYQDDPVWYQNDPIWYQDRFGKNGINALNRAFVWLANEGLLPKAYDEFSIHWSQNVSEFTIQYSLNDMEKVYESNRVQTLQIEVPTKGCYVINSESGGISSWISFDEPIAGTYETSSDGQIGGNILSVNEDSSKVKSIIVGCPTMNKALDSYIRDYSIDQNKKRFAQASWYRD